MVAIVAPKADATPLLPGDTVVPGVIPDPGVLVMSLESVFAGGTLTSWVYNAAGGGYDFYYQVSLDETTEPVPLIVTGYAGLTTDVGYTFPVPAGVFVPTSATRESDPPGDEITFVFPRVFDFAPSAQVGVLAAAPGWAELSLGGSVNGSAVTILAPSPIPEPTSLLLLSTGLAAFGVRLRIKRRSEQNAAPR